MCGNATQMAVSVDNTWLDILQEVLAVLAI